VEDRSRIALSVLVGAAVGGVLGYLLLTDAGRRARVGLRGELEGLLDEANRFSGSIERVRGVASDGWHSLKEVFAALTEGEPPSDEPDPAERVS
jgi:hypothetical protein